MNKIKNINKYMDYFLDKPKLICKSLGTCKESSCEMLHPRFLIGVCIKFLNLSFKKEYKNKKCMKGKNCGLEHFNKKALIKAINLTPINGVFPFNLCPDAEECRNPDCLYLHREWINDEKICLKNLVGECH